jgi:hypothetical protein
MDKVQKPSNSEPVICSMALSNASMKPSKLMRHQKTKHNNKIETKRIEFFRRKRDRMEQQQRGFPKVAETDPAVLKASVAIALRTVKSVKPHTKAEELILTSAVDTEKTVLWGECCRVCVTAFPNNTISRRISAIRRYERRVNHYRIIFCGISLQRSVVS